MVRRARSPQSAPEPAIETVAKDFFGKEMSISSRARAGLMEAARCIDLFGAKIALTSPVELFGALVRCSPACSDIFVREKLVVNDLPGDTQEISRADLRIRIDTNYREVFAAAFGPRWLERTRFNDTGTIVCQSGFISEIDLVVGYLENGHSRPFTDSILHALLAPNGLIEYGVVSERGDELLSKLEQQFRSVGNVDPSHHQQQFVFFLDDAGKLRVRPCGANAIGRMDGEGGDYGPFLFRGGVIQDYASFNPYGESALEEFEGLVNSSETKESDFQTFFERHPDLLTGIDFDHAFPHPILHRDEGGPLIPDFFLEKVDAGWSAIVDLKLASDRMVIRRPNRTYFAQWIHEATAQLRFYREWFDNPQNCRAMEKKLGLRAKVFRPRVVLVAGRNRSFRDEIERIRLLSEGGSTFELWTYDDVLERAKRLRKRLFGSTH